MIKNSLIKNKFLNIKIEIKNIKYLIISILIF
jgi:hypothetical protein